MEQVWPDGTTPLVSIFCITYNHVNFIRDAIEGFLMQETTFPVEIFVHDDASTDGTADIVREYSEKYHKLFWTLMQTENQYSKNRGVFFNLLQKQRGEFIAICEGDDYWTSSRKIQKQFEQMQKNPTASFCFHNTHIIDNLGNLSGEIRPYNGSFLHSISELFLNNFIHTSSILFRRSKFLGIPESLKNSPMGDWPLCILLAENGPFLYLDEIMSRYRLHSGSSWSSKTQAERSEQTCRFFELLLEYFKDNQQIMEYVLNGYQIHCNNSTKEFYSLILKMESQIKNLKSELKSLKNSKIWRFSWPIRLIDKSLKLFLRKIL